MRRIMRTTFLLAFAVLLTAISVFAHHSAAAKYDQEKKITITGTIVQTEWKNPHCYFFVDVKDASNKVTRYAIEGGSINGLYRSGWKKDTVKIGDTVTVSGFLARMGTPEINGRTFTLANGRKMFAGSADDGLPQY
jgi:Family of unknown function (DUF6152)